MLKNIQGLRFFAALCVVILHLPPQTLAISTPDSLFGKLSTFGYLGVDIFFVISGFIMAKTTRNHPSEWRCALIFLTHRFSRIYVGWWIFLALYMFIGMRFGGVSQEASLLGSIVLWPMTLYQYTIPVLWTLSFELYFYALVAVLILWNRKKAGFVLGAAGVGILLFNLGCISTGMYLPQNMTPAHYMMIIPFVLSPFIMEFIAGFLIFEWFMTKPPKRWMPWVLGAIFFLLAGICYQLFGNLRYGGLSGFFHSTERALLFGACATCIVAAAIALEMHGATCPTVFQALGDASYCMYLSHLLIFTLLTQAGDIFQSQWSWNPSTRGWVAIFIIILTSWSFHRWLERPIYRVVRKFLTRYISGDTVVNTH